MSSNRGKARNSNSNNASANSKHARPAYGQKGKRVSALSTMGSDSAEGVPIVRQEAVLRIFETSFPELLSSTTIPRTLQPLLQEVKGYLYNREFDKAFGRNDLLEAYAVRWSASRTLGYMDIFKEVFGYFQVHSASGEQQSDDRDNHEGREHSSFRTVTCFGGGAGAELCALAGVKLTTQGDAFGLDIIAIDIADWSSIISALHTSITSSPPLSVYASAAAKAANVPLVEPTHLRTTFNRMDLLDLSESSQRTLHSALAASALVTIMFTLNELYSTSVSKTQKLLLDLTANMSEGALLLVVDSPGSYSTVTVNHREKKYPMSWLLDYTLSNVTAVAPGAPIESRNVGANARVSGEDAEGELMRNRSAEPHGQETRAISDGSVQKSDHITAAWEKLVSDESRWFRLPEGLKYPIDLENMRYQMHLFRRL